ncbi:MAG: AraC family transcriptional regulator [Flavobacteriaceae bacterium]|nr:AraC family transcriptional regulator [Flavobacteriaceae bacterium]
MRINQSDDFHFVKILKAGKTPIAMHHLTNKKEVHSTYLKMHRVVVLIRGGLVLKSEIDGNIEFHEGDILLLPKYANYISERRMDKEGNFEVISFLIPDVLVLEILQKRSTPIGKHQIDFLVPKEGVEKIVEGIQLQFNQKCHMSLENWGSMQFLIKNFLLQIPTLQFQSIFRDVDDRLLSYLETQKNRRTTIPQMALDLGQSTSSFYRSFRNRMGKAPAKWMREQRLYHARFYMMFTQKPISQISSELGYEDLSQFSKAFKKKFGYNPSEYHNNFHIVFD